MKMHRFTKPDVLRRVGRQLMERFLAGFAEDLQARQIKPPSPDSTDDEYFQELAQLLLAPQGLPDRLNEALVAIDEMATGAGQEALESALSQAGLEIQFAPESSPEDIALQVWLAAPELLVRKHNERRLLRLEIFECFRGRQAGVQAGGKTGAVKDRSDWSGRLAAVLDPWFEAHNRGRQTARVQTYDLQGEHWFLVRHGDTFTRRSKVEQQKTELLHYRPERDDVVVYSPHHDEIRVNARTRGEKELYRRMFGLVLQGSEDYFQARPAYTLEPLRVDGPAALDSDGLEGIAKIVLTEIQIASGDFFQKIITTEAADIFACAAASEDDVPLIPEDGILTRAAFELQFEDSAMIASVQIRPPNVLRLGRHCDVRKVSQWLSRRGFKER